MGGGLGTIGGSMVVPAGAAGWGGELPGGPGGGLILILWGFPRVPLCWAHGMGAPSLIPDSLEGKGKAGADPSPS